MQRTPETVLNNWLTRLNIRVSPKLINRHLQSHANYPSLLSITDTLEDLGIENIAFKIEKNQLHEVATPFLAHIRTEGGDFIIVENRDTLEEIYPGFFNNWSGVVVAAEKPALWSNKENNEWLQQEKELHNKRIAGITAVTLFALAAIVFVANWLAAALICLAATGVFVSWLITTKSLGIENKIADQVCGKEADCDAIIQSKSSKLPLGISFSDIGLIWFTSLFTALILASFTGYLPALINPLFMLSVLALPFTAFSVFYQWRIAKKWCRLCLITVVLLWIQFAILSTNFPGFSWQAINVKSLFFIAGILGMVSIAWFLIKLLLQQNKKLEKASFEGIRFKRNEKIFAALLEKQKRVDFTPWEKDLQLSNADAPLQITVACNPYCGPCVVAHETLHELIETYGDTTGLTIRFNVKAKDKGNLITQAVQYMLQHIESATIGMNAAEKTVYTKKVLHQWFKMMNYDEFTTKYPFAGDIDVTDILMHHEDWFSKHNITATPTIFINGRQLPREYRATDLKNILKNFTAQTTVYNAVEA